MRVYAEYEIKNNEVKLRLQVNNEWYAVRIPEPLFEQLKHEKGEIIKQVLMVQ